MISEGLPESVRSVENISSEITDFLQKNGHRLLEVPSEPNYLRFQILDETEARISDHAMVNFARQIEKRCFSVREGEIDLVPITENDIIPDQNIASTVNCLVITLDKN